MPREARVHRRRYLQAIGGTVSTLSVAGCQSGSGDSQTLTAGTAPGFPPFEMKQDGELVYPVKYSSLASFITVQELYGRQEPSLTRRTSTLSSSCW